MVKAKFGALALTVLMGLGAVSPLHGVTEAHALNAPVANSAQQKTVVSTTDDSDGVMSYKDKESGKTFVSEDNGANWMSEEDYNNSHPAINYEWWTYDEYKEWLEQEKKTLQEMADEHAMAETSEGSFEWTQEMTDQYIAEYRDREYNLASRCLGTRLSRVLTRNILPYLISVIILRVALSIPSTIGLETTLSYLGLGLDINIPSLGILLRNSRAFFLDYPYLLIFPAVIVSLVTITFYLAGNAFSDAADPRNHV